MRSAAPAPAIGPPDGADQIFTVWAGGAQWAVPAAAVQTVFRVGTITPVPLSSAVIAGLVNLRGRVIVAVNLSLRLLGQGGSGGDAAKTPFAIAVEHGGDVFALLVDKVGDVIVVSGDAHVEPPAHMVADLARMTRYWLRTAGALVPVLDLGRVLQIDSDRRSGIERRAAHPTETGARS